VFLEMGLYRSWIEFLVMFEVVQQIAGYLWYILFKKA